MNYLNEKQKQQYLEFYNKHVIKCKIKFPKTVHVHLNNHFRITPTGIGDAITYFCKCGKYIALTDFSKW